MENAETILVIFLSSFLALFLLLGVVLIVNLIRLVRKINEVAEAAGEIVQNVESASELFKKAAGPMAAGKFLVNIADMVMKHRKDK